jgi:hypothetical protein
VEIIFFFPAFSAPLREIPFLETRKISLSSLIATVNFELNGEKKIMLNYAKLRIVE